MGLPPSRPAEGRSPAKIANIVAADVVGKPAATAKLTEADGKLTAVEAAFAAYDYLNALRLAREAYEAVVAGAAAANVPVSIVEPSTWTVIYSGKPGNGPGKGNAKARYAKDLEERANVKRMFGK